MFVTLTTDSTYVPDITTEPTLSTVRVLRVAPESITYSVPTGATTDDALLFRKNIERVLSVSFDVAMVTLASVATAVERTCNVR